MPSSAFSTSDLYTLSLHDALPIWRMQTAVPAKTSNVVNSHFRLNIFASIIPLPFSFEAQRRSTTRSVCQVGYRCTGRRISAWTTSRSEEHTSELQSQSNLVCRLLLSRPPISTLFPYTTLFRSGECKLPCQQKQAMW